MATRLYWVPGPWKGRLALSPRPRGGDWLGDEVAEWKRSGVSLVVSLLEPQEESDLGLGYEAAEVKSKGMKFLSLPIADRGVPPSEAKVAEALDRISNNLASGKNTVVHCRQGVGRTGMVASCLLVRSGMSPGAAVETVSAARGVAVPETHEQREWIDHYAAALAK
jgi:protein-tyrosine phosphatase